MKKDVLVSLAWAGGIVLLSLIAALLLTMGYINKDTTLRVVAMNGLMAAYYGNRVPKVIAPSADARKVKRVAGWSLVVGGLIYAGFWAFAPIPLAMTIGTGALAIGVIVTLAYGLWLRVRTSAG